MYKNLVFDLGGVVINYNPRDFLVETFFHEKTENTLYGAVFCSPEWLMLDRGDISWADACGIFMRRGEEADLKFEMGTVLELWTQMLTTRKATIELMRLFKKKGFNLYYLSNLSKQSLALLSKRDFWPLFDGGVASCEVGICKPDLEIYRILIDRYSLVPQETIYTDDNPENASTAFLVGITGIQFKDIKNLCEMLVTYGIDMGYI